MNRGAAKEVPWGLEQTPLPASGSLSGTRAVVIVVAIGVAFPLAGAALLAVILPEFVVIRHVAPLKRALA